jgi:hypothetical protein
MTITIPGSLAVSPAAPVSLFTIVLNANGLADPMKLTAIRTMVHNANPHAFIISENSEPVSSRLELNDYDLHENLGRPPNARGKGKWGVIVGIWHGMFNVGVSGLWPSPPAHQVTYQVIPSCDLSTHAMFVRVG